MTCPRCAGFTTPEHFADVLDTLDCHGWRCWNCGWRGLPPAPVCKPDVPYVRDRSARADYMQQLRRERLAAGQCGNCGKKPVVAGKTKCRYCLQYLKAYHLREKQQEAIA